MRGHGVLSSKYITYHSLFSKALKDHYRKSEGARGNSTTEEQYLPGIIVQLHNEPTISGPVCIRYAQDQSSKSQYVLRSGS